MKKKGIFALACLGHFHVDFFWGMWTILKTYLNIDLAVAGLIVGICTFTAEILQVFWGSWSDRGYRFLILAFGMVMVNAFSFLPNVPPHLALFLFLPVAIGSSAFHPAAAGIVGQYNPERRGFFMALFWACGAIGLSCSQLIFSYMFTNHQNLFFLMSLPGIAFALIAVAYFKQDASPAAPKKFALSSFLAFFKRKDTLFLWMAQVFISSIYWGTLFLLPDILIDKGYPIWISGGTAHLFYVIGAAATSLAAGWLADKTSPKWVMFGGVLLGSFFFFTLVLSDAMQPVAILGCCFLTGAMLGQCSPLSLALGNALVPENPALISGFLMGFVWFIAESIGTTGTGFITKLFDSHQPTHALTCLGLLFVPALIALVLMPLKAKEWSSQTT